MSKDAPMQWTMEATRLLVDLLLEEVVSGHRPNKVLLVPARDRVIKLFNKSRISPSKLTDKKLKDKWYNSKRMCTILQKWRRAETKLGYNQQTGLITVPQHFWDRTLTNSKHARALKNGKFLFGDIWVEIFNWLPVKVREVGSAYGGKVPTNKFEEGLGDSDDPEFGVNNTTTSSVKRKSLEPEFEICPVGDDVRQTRKGEGVAKRRRSTFWPSTDEGSIGIIDGFQETVKYLATCKGSEDRASGLIDLALKLMRETPGFEWGSKMGHMCLCFLTNSFKSVNFVLFLYAKTPEERFRLVKEFAEDRERRRL